MKKKLTLKQQRFINAYFETGNLTEAARLAGYRGNDEVLASIGYQNFRKIQIQQRIKERVAAQGVTATEVINTLATQMRADATDLFNEHGGFDLETLKKRGLGSVIRKVKCKRVWEDRGEEEKTPVDLIEIELYSAQQAAVKLCDLLGINQEAQKNQSDLRRILTEAERIASEYGKPLDEVKRDIVARKPELASFLIQ